MKVKTLVVGLGNPGKKYELTRHNIGFMILDKLCDSEFRFEKKFNAEVCESEGTVLMKPQTFMNLSGESVRSFFDYYKLSPENIWVIHDDIDIPFGEIRVKTDGSSAGHKGIESIIQKLGTKDFLRFRVGVKNEMLGSIEAEDFVLQKFSPEEQEKLPKILDACIKEIKSGDTTPRTVKID